MAVVDILQGLGFKVNANCIRILGYAASGIKATVKAEDPLFAK
jgi:hypothetical protein